MLSAGASLGPYEVVSPLGAGGMGEVYRARDTKLGREVALKVLPEAFTSDADRLARFEREAKVLASLNYPNIGHIYGLEEAEGRKALVLELVEGPTLADRIAEGPIPIDEALPIARQIAEALEAAHEQGIVHRDLKPANVKVKPDGTVKVLDFGLAKANASDVAASGSSSDFSESPTLAHSGTVAGVILGTAAYMSPEQARGRPVDKRADIWAFGAVLYEMLTGQRPFQGEDVSLTLAAVMTAEPELGALPRAVPPLLRVFLGRCLEKDAKRRVQAIGDMRLALEGAFEAGGPHETPVKTPWHRGALPWLIAVAMAIVALAAVFFIPGEQADTALRSQRRFTVESAPGTTLTQGLGTAIAISPDGETLVFSAEGDAGRQLYRRSLSEFDAEPIRGTDGALMPFFSPDGQWVGFGDASLTEIKRVPLSGGEPFRVCRPCTDGSWADDGRIAFEWGGTLYRIAESGGEPETLVEPSRERGLFSLGRVSLLPTGTAVLFDINQFSRGGVGVVSLETGELVVISDYGSDPVFSPTGHVLFARERTLIAVPFDVERFAVTGPETPVLSGVRVENGGSVQVALSRKGAIVYAPGSEEVGTQLVWVNHRSGEVEQVLEEGRFFRAPRLSPDGRKIAVQINAEGGNDVWIHEAGTLRPITNEGDASHPIWTPDGRAVTFARGLGQTFAIQSLPSDGGGRPHTILEADVPIIPEAWCLDGARLIFRERADLFITDLREPGSRMPFVVSEFTERSATFSPSGEWVAYVSNQNGSNEVYVRPFPGPGGERRVSRGGGSAPSWGSGDDELVFIARDGVAVAASLRLARAEVVERLEPLFASGPYWRGWGGTHYDVHPGDRRLLMLRQKDSTATTSRLRVVENWFSELEELAGAGR